MEVRTGMFEHRMRVSLEIFSLASIRQACRLCALDLEADVIATTAKSATVRLAAKDVAVGSALERRFLRAVINAEVDRQALADDPDSVRHFANSISSITHEGYRGLSQTAPQELDALPCSTEPCAKRDANRQPEPTITTIGGKSVIELDSSRYLLPAILAAGKDLSADMHLAVDARSPSQISVTIEPLKRDPAAAAKDFLAYVQRWQLPPPGSSLPAWARDGGESRNSAENPWQPRNGYPYTLYRAIYGAWKGVPATYRINEISSMEIDHDQILVSNRHRGWALLTKRDYDQLMAHTLHRDSHLFRVCEAIGLILTDRNVEALGAYYAARYLFMHQPPSLFIIVMTNRCNMACTYCHAEAESSGDKTRDMSEETLRKSIDFFFSIPRPANQKTIAIEFQGGECLLRWDLIRKAMDYATEKAHWAKRDIRFCVCTNLTTITAEIADEMKRRGNVVLSSSLDGPRTLHDQQRCFAGGGGTYDRVLKAYDYITNDRGIWAGLMPTITKNHVGRVRELIDEYGRQKQSTVFLKPASQVGRAYESRDAIGLTPDEFFELWQDAIDYICNLNADGHHMRERWTNDIIGNFSNCGNSYMCMRRPCGCGISQVAIDPQGNVCACDQARSIPLLWLGNVHTESYENCYASEAARILRTMTSELLPRCRSCALSPFCGLCVCRAVRQHGSPRPIIPVDLECATYSRLIPALLRRLRLPANAATATRWQSESKR